MTNPPKFADETPQSEIVIRCTEEQWYELWCDLDKHRADEIRIDRKVLTNLFEDFEAGGFAPPTDLITAQTRQNSRTVMVSRPRLFEFLKQISEFYANCESRGLRMPSK